MRIDIRATSWVALLLTAASAPTQTILNLHSTVSGGRNDVPGQARTWTSSFGRIMASPNGRYYAFLGVANNAPLTPSTLRTHVLGQAGDPSLAVVTAQQNSASPVAGFLVNDLRTGPGVQNDGRMVFIGTCNAATNLDDFLAVYDPATGTSTLIAREQGANPLGAFANFFAGGHWANDVVAFQTGSNQTIGVGGILRGAGPFTVLSERLVTVPTGQLSSPAPVQWFANDSARSSPYGTTLMYRARVNPGSSNHDDVLVVNNHVVIQEGFPIPGTTVPTTVTTIHDGGSSQSQVSSDGSYFVFRATLQNGAEVAVLGRALPTISVLETIQRGDPVGVNTSEAWADPSANTSLFAMGVNQYGEYVVGGFTNESDITRNWVLAFYNGASRKVVLRENTPVDMDGNGLLDDNAFISSIASDNIAWCDNARLYIGATMRNAAGTTIGIANLQIDLPIPGDVNLDGEVGPADFSEVLAGFGAEVGNPGYTNGEPDATDRDQDDNGEVGPGDFSMVLRNFGRER